MSEVIYARVPETVKEAAEGYAAQRGTTLTATVVDLLERGLAAATDSKSVAGLEAQLARSRTQTVQLKGELQAAYTELQSVQAVAQRAALRVATCPKCAAGVSGYDLLALGRCTHCNEPLGALVASAAPGPLDQREFLLLIGALGALLGAAFLASKS